MVENIKKRIVPSLKTYKYVKAVQYGKKEDLEKNVSEAEISSMYNLGFLSCGIDSKKELRFRATDKCLKQATIYCDLSEIINILKETVSSSSNGVE